MDTDAAPSGPTMPRSATFEPASEAAPGSRAQSTGAPSRESRAAVAATMADGHERNGVFGHLVTDDADIAGLVAYSIYKQHKLDWLRAFEAAKGRAPEEAELSAYIIGEGTPRRLATYRHLAEATLAGNGPAADGGGEPGSRSAVPSRRLAARRDSMVGGLAVLYALIAVLFVFGFWLALHYTSTR